MTYHFLRSPDKRPGIFAHRNPIRKNPGTFVRTPQKVAGHFFEDTYVCTYVRTYVGSTYVCMYVRTSVCRRRYVHAYVRACACVCVCVSTCLLACVRTWVIRVSTGVSYHNVMYVRLYLYAYIMFEGLIQYEELLDSFVLVDTFISSTEED